MRSDKVEKLLTRFPYLFDASPEVAGGVVGEVSSPRVVESLVRLLSALFLSEAVRRNPGDDRVVRFLDYELDSAPLRAWIELMRSLLEERRVAFEEVFALESKLQDLIQTLTRRYIDYLERLQAQLAPNARETDPALVAEFIDFLLTYFKSEIREEAGSGLRLVNRDRESGFRLPPLVRGGFGSMETFSGVTQSGLVYHSLNTNARRESQEPEVLKEFAELLIGTGSYRQALQTYQKLGRPDPSSRPPAVVFAIHCHRGRELARQGKYAQAVVELERALKIRDDVNVVHFQLALAYSRLGNHAQAIQILVRLVDDNAGLDRPSELLGDLLHAKGDVAEARKMYDRAFIANPYNRSVERKRQRLGADAATELRAPARSSAVAVPADPGKPARATGEARNPDAKRESDPIQELLVDLTEAARENRFHPALGREAELAELIEVLSCKVRSNPLLVGEPGVGKTALVEELARRLVAGLVPPTLRGKKLYLMSVASLLAGAKFRGQFEERVLQLVQALKAEPCILFIDDIHTIVNAGMSKGGTLDTSSLLKPALVRGEIQVIGATTLDEYRNNIEKDPSLVRSTQLITIEEPAHSALEEILAGHRDRLAVHHQVRFGADVELLEVVRLSRITLRERRLPDVAINVLDRAAARVRLRAAAADLPIDLAATLDTRIEAESPPLVSRDDILAVMSDLSGVPLSRLSEGEIDRYRRMEDHLAARVVGQDEAVSAVGRVLRTTKLNFDLNSQRPDGVFLFVGPSGVGKTELARAIAEFLFGNEESVIRIDMSEYMERISASRLIGTAPGYVGYNDQNQLTDQVRRSPYSLVLLDEVEKADSSMLNLFLQVFDAGRLTDGKGRTVHFDNTTIIMTSNVGTHLYSQVRAGYGSEGGGRQDVSRGELKREVKRYFPPEFLNRIDEIVFFRPLDEVDIRHIAELQLRDLIARLLERGIDLEIGDEVFRVLAREGYTPEFGARGLHRTIRRRILDPMALLSLAPEFHQATRVVVSARDERIEVALGTVDGALLEPIELGTAEETDLEAGE